MGRSGINIKAKCLKTIKREFLVIQRYFVFYLSCNMINIDDNSNLYSEMYVNWKIHTCMWQVTVICMLNIGMLPHSKYARKTYFVVNDFNYSKFNAYELSNIAYVFGTLFMFGAFTSFPNQKHISRSWIIFFSGKICCFLLIPCMMQNHSII